MLILSSCHQMYHYLFWYSRYQLVTWIIILIPFCIDNRWWQENDLLFHIYLRQGVSLSRLVEVHQEVGSVPTALVLAWGSSEGRWSGFLLGLFRDPSRDWKLSMSPILTSASSPELLSSQNSSFKAPLFVLNKTLKIEIIGLRQRILRALKRSYYDIIWI